MQRSVPFTENFVTLQNRWMPHSLLFRNLLLDIGNKKLEEKVNKDEVEHITEAIKADALETYVSMIHLMALTDVIWHQIMSV